MRKLYTEYDFAELKAHSLSFCYKNNSMTRLIYYSLAAVFIALNASQALSNVISSSGVEVKYEYNATFRTLWTKDLKDSLTAKELAEFHTAHLFGFFHSRNYTKPFLKSYYLNEGFAGNKHTEITSAESYAVPGDKYLWVKYSAQGQMIVNRHVVKKWLGDKKSGKVKFPLLSDMPSIYKDFVESEEEYVYADEKLIKCTDEHYSSALDFSYFYDPFLCRYLSRTPIAKDTTFHIHVIESQDKKIPFSEILSDNQNGKLTTAYFIFGFDKAPGKGSSVKEIQKDSSWKLYASVDEKLTQKYGFKKVTELDALRKWLGEDFKNIKLEQPATLVHNDQRRYFSTFVRHDKNHTWVVRSGLFDSSNSFESSTVTFPKFWKEAWENGDFIYYGGHSGDGVSVNLENILNKLSKKQIESIQFNKTKTQIAFFDACSSYHHYLDIYTEQKTSNLFVMNYGLVSLFETADATMNMILKSIIVKQAEEKNWFVFLNEIELSHLPPVLNLWGQNTTYWNNYFTKKKLPPSFLLNVHTP